MELIQSYIAELSEINDLRKIYPNQIYHLISRLELQVAEAREFEEQVLPKIYDLFDDGKIKKDLFFLCLLTNESADVLRMFLKHEQASVVLNINDPVSLFDICFYRNRHWLLEILDDHNNDHCCFTTSPSIANKVKILKLLMLTNNAHIDVERIEILMECAASIQDTFMSAYVDTIRYILDVMKFVKAAKANVDCSQLYRFITCNNVLQTFSEHIDLSEPQKWTDVSRMLSEIELLYKKHFHHANQNTSDYSDSEVFKAFTITLALIEALRLCKDTHTSKATKKDEITGTVEAIKEKLLLLDNNALVTEILENVFCLTFLRYAHFPTGERAGCSDEFFCAEPEIRLILSFLKSVFEEIRKKNSMKRSSAEFRWFLELNKHVSDATWRLELITSVRASKSSENCGGRSNRSIMHYMLASPEALINLCLKADDVEKANQVVQIFGLEDTDLAHHINHTVKHKKLQHDLKKLFARESPDKKYRTQQLIDNHFKDFSNAETNNDIIIESIENNAPFTRNNQKSLDLFDLFLTAPRNHNDSKILLELYEHHFAYDRSSSYSAFCTKILNIFNYDTIPAHEILASPGNCLDLDAYANEKGKYEKLRGVYDQFQKQLKTKETAGTFNLNHVAPKTLLLIEEACVTFGATEEKEPIKYMQKLLNYLKTLSRLLFVERNNSDSIAKGREVSVLELLNKSRTKLIGELIYEKNLDGSDFDPIFSKLKLDLTYHIAAASFPKITYNYERDSPPPETPGCCLHRPRRDVISYVQKRNWLLAFVLNKIHKIQDAKIDINEVRVKALTNLIGLRDTQKLKALYDNNDVVTVLQQNFWRRMDDYLLRRKARASDEAEVSEDCVDVYELLTSLPENEALEAVEFNSVKDEVLCEMVAKKTVPHWYEYVRFISANELRVETILSNFRNWPGDFCVNVIRSELTRHRRVEESYRGTLRIWLDKVELCEQLRVLYPNDSWFDIEEKCEHNGQMVLQRIVSTTNIDVLLRFISVHCEDAEDLSAITVDYVESLLAEDVPLNKIKILLKRLPNQADLKLCEQLLRRATNLTHLEFAVRHLLENAEEHFVDLKNVRLTLKMMTCFSADEQEQHRSLIREPLNIIEVLLMNTKLDKLGQMLDAIRPDLEKSEFDENALAVEKVDELLRRYAEKSLEFKVVTRPRTLRTPDNKIMVSIDSLGLERKPFAMPETVPDKIDWVENDDVTDCMCCQQVAFSMFNRRHHCRRCGRVVCWNCSLKRMQVANYGDILVRVCNDCYDQTYRHSGSSSSAGDFSSKSINDEYWLLTDDPEHNVIVREEFSYENAPSVSLCLSILKYHSKSEDYPKFLLNQCDNILKLLQPIADCTMEIDYNLIIKMLMSLAVAAKVISNQCMLQWGTSLADKILSQAELLGLLSERGCLNLIPKSAQSQCPYVDAAVLRRIRDRLLEQEQWNLALEVSTKAGLDNTAVFAIWGKSCLKAGNLQLARVKFQRCFDKTAYYDTSEFSSMNDSDASLEAVRQRRHSKLLSHLHPISDSKPFRNPPLLNEIIQILEATTSKISESILADFRNAGDLYGSTTSLTQSPNLQARHTTSICIINKLRNLEAIAAGSYTFLTDDKSLDGSNSRLHKPHLDVVFHDECVYYLNRYGTHLSLCLFYIRHAEFDNALYNIVENHLNFDVFIEIYMLCLKDGLVDVLHESIVKIDSTFDLWKDYLRCLCIHLEKQSMLHSLYQLQQFMGDFVRAAMTCIKFYTDSVTTFEDLSSRVEYLHKARDHLKQGLEQEQWVEVSTVRSMSDSYHDTFEEKALTNPALVMKMSAKEVERHISTIVRQIDLVLFLADCEKAGKPVAALVQDLMLILNDKTRKSRRAFVLPTLFGSVYEKLQLAVLAIVCAVNVPDGFTVAHRLVQSYKLKAVKVYCEAGRQLAKAKQHSAISQLVQCIHGTGEKDVLVTEMCDDMLALAARTLGDNNATDGQIEDIIKHITNRAMKINSYIETKQLRSAFLVAAKFSRFNDIQRISREAELLNKPDVKKMCQKFLLTRPQTNAPQQPRS